jgi:hypothetical protein
LHEKFTELENGYFRILKKKQLMKRRELFVSIFLKKSSITTGLQLG